MLDELLDLHDRIIGKVFNAAKNRHQQRFQASGKAINQQVRLFGRVGQALLQARETGTDPFAAIGAVVPWAEFTARVDEAQQLAQPADFDFLHLVGEHYATLRRYAPAFLAALPLRAAPVARSLLAAIEVLRQLNASGARKLPADAPTAFLSRRWQKLVLTEEGIDRRYYELCVLAELKNALRAGDRWVLGSRQFKDFEEYLVPADRFGRLLQAEGLPLAVETDGEAYVQRQLGHLAHQLETVNRLAAAGELPEASLTAAGLKITPLDAAVPAAAQALIDQVARLLPRGKIADLLLEVDEWTSFSRHFTHLKTGTSAKDPAFVADHAAGRWTEPGPDQDGRGVSRLDPGPARVAPGLAHPRRHVCAGLGRSGEGATERPPRRTGSGFGPAAGRRAPATLIPNTGLSRDDYFIPTSRTSTRLLAANSSMSACATLPTCWMGCYHEPDLRIAEHYTDTAGFTDHLFGLLPLLSYRFAPRIRDLSDTKLYVPPGSPVYEALQPLLGGSLNVRHILAHWEEILRLATSIKQGTATASLMLRKLGSYPRQNGLAVALRELGRLERSLFILDWLQSVERRRRVQVGLNKGEARNALARAVFFHRLGEIRDRGFEQQRYRASGLNLLTAAIVRWNTVYLERAVQSLRAHGQLVDEALLPYLSPLGWEHINLTGDCSWRTKRPMGKFHPLRPLSKP